MKAYITFDQFLTELKPCHNLAAFTEDDNQLNQPGLTWRGYWIEDHNDDDGVLRYYTLIERSEYESDDLRVVARPLFDFLVGEGLIDPRGTAVPRILQRVNAMSKLVRDIADMKMDNECEEHGADCALYGPDCEYFVMENDDAIVTLSRLIEEARAIEKESV